MDEFIVTLLDALIRNAVRYERHRVRSLDASWCSSGTIEQSKRFVMACHRLSYGVMTALARYPVSCRVMAQSIQIAYGTQSLVLSLAKRLFRGRISRLRDE